MKKINTESLIAGLVILFIIIFLIFSGIFKKDDSEIIRGNDLNPEDAFTFFGVGPNTTYSGKLREDLRKVLGSDAIATWTTINLEIISPDFIQKHFPQIHQLNLKLNENATRRIEHNTTRLNYRYIPDRITAFNYVELLFSNYSQKPLYCKIHAKDEASDILEMLKTMHGEPKKIDWGKPEEYSLFWKSHGDVMVFSKTLDKIGNPTFRIMTYYVNNIEKLIKQEEMETKTQEKEAKDALKRVF